MAEQDAPALEARFIRLKESIANQLTAFSPIGVVVESHAKKKAEESRQRALAALGSAALALTAKDPELAARLLRKASAGDREQVRELLSQVPAGKAKKKKGKKKAGKKAGSKGQGPAGGDDPSTWSAADLRRFVEEHQPRNRTELRKQHGAVYRQLREEHPQLLEELLPSQRGQGGGDS